RVERDAVSGGLQAKSVEGFEYDRLRLRLATQQPRTGWQRRTVRVTLWSNGETNPRSRVGAVGHEVVDEACVAANRDAVPCGGQLCLGRHRVLEVAQVVGGVRKHFYERHADVGRIALFPAWHHHRQPIQHQLAEACKILRQIVDGWLRRTWRGTCLD